VQDGSHGVLHMAPQDLASCQTGPKASESKEI
jgi:hypothetical protein